MTRKEIIDGHPVFFVKREDFRYPEAFHHYCTTTFGVFIIDLVDPGHETLSNKPIRPYNDYYGRHLFPLLYGFNFPKDGTTTREETGKEFAVVVLEDFLDIPQELVKVGIAEMITRLETIKGGELLDFYIEQSVEKKMLEKFDPTTYMKFFQEAVTRMYQAQAAERFMKVSDFMMTTAVTESVRYRWFQGKIKALQKVQSKKAQ